MRKELKTMRYCVNCKKNTLFELNKVLGHSECVECGSRYASPIKDIIKLMDLLDYFDARVKELESGRKHKELSDNNELLSLIGINVRLKELNFLKKNVVKLVKT